jgi:hypothetical protein
MIQKHYSQFFQFRVSEKLQNTSLKKKKQMTAKKII